MPTGYTSGILDGEIKSFPDFAKLCMRAFGATIHMRDEDLGVRWIPRTIEQNDYNLKNIERCKDSLNRLLTTKDSELVSDEKKSLEKRIRYHKKKVREIKKVRKNLDAFLEEANSYTPPTEDHHGIKEFMINQIQMTIDHDGSWKYHDEQIDLLTTRLLNIDPAILRIQETERIEKELAYHQKQLDEEKERCEKANGWVESFLKSLES
jgi:hypothetical protein